MSMYNLKCEHTADNRQATTGTYVGCLTSQKTDRFKEEQTNNDNKLKRTDKNNGAQQIKSTPSLVTVKPIRDINVFTA